MSKNHIPENQEDSDYFGELTPEQKDFLKNFLLINFGIEIWNIDNSINFVLGKVNVISLGMIYVIRTNKWNALIKTSIENAPMPFKKNPENKNLFIVLALPDR